METMSASVNVAGREGIAPMMWMNVSNNQISVAMASAKTKRDPTNVTVHPVLPEFIVTRMWTSVSVIPVSTVPHATTR